MTASATCLIDQAADAGYVLRRKSNRLSCVGSVEGAASSSLLRMLSDHKAIILNHLEARERQYAHLHAMLESSLPISPLQADIYYEYLMNPQSSAYNVAFVIEACGPFDCAAWASAWARALTRHCNLRSLFTEDDDGTLRQLVFDTPPLPIRMADLTALSREAQAEPIRAMLARTLDEPFELSSHLPLRLAVIARGPHQHLLAICLHHIVTDPDSLSLLIEEIRATYTAASAPGPVPVEPPEISDALSSVRHRSWLQSHECAQELRTCCDRIRGVPALFDFVRTDTATERLRTYPLEAARELMLVSTAAARRTTPFVVVLAAYARALSRATGRGEFLIGLPARALMSAVAQRALSCFVNLLPIRITAPFREPALFLDDLSGQVRDTLSRQRVPLSLIRQSLAAQRQRPPEIQAALTFVTHQLDLGDWPNLSLRCLDVRTLEAKFPVNAQLRLTGGVLRGEVQVSERVRSIGSLVEIAPLILAELRSLLQALQL